MVPFTTGECSPEPRLPDAPHGYTRRKNECIPCSSKEVSVVWLSLSVVGLWATLVHKSANRSEEKSKSISTALWRIFISYYGLCATTGEFMAAGTPLFVDYTQSFTRLASVLDIGFEPVTCSGIPYLLVFVAKAAAPYAFILCVAARTNAPFPMPPCVCVERYGRASRAKLLTYM